MNFCPNCGSPLKKDDLFCTNCGEKLHFPDYKDHEKHSNQINSIDEEKISDYNPNQSIYSKDQPGELSVNKEVVKPRMILRAIYLFFLSITVIIVLVGLTSKGSVVAGSFTAGSFYLAIALIFKVLSITPKEERYVNIFGFKNHTLTKGKFIAFGLGIAIILPVIASIMFLPSSRPSNGDSQKLIAIDNENQEESKEVEGDDILNEIKIEEDDDNIVNEIEEAPIIDLKEDLLIIDAQQFSEISSNELIEILGEPALIEDGNFIGVITIPCVRYTYNNVGKLKDVDFTLINDRVIHFISYTDLEFPRGMELEAVGLDIPRSEAGIIPTASSASRIRTPSTNIDEIWFDNIEGEMFNFLKITYNLMYSEEWYLSPTTNEESYANIEAQKIIKSLLVSPSSAKFPRITSWKFAKNPYYIAAQAYVDADNSFGATIRSNFTVYFDTGGYLRKVIFDGEEIYNDGFIPYADLIEDLAGI